MLLVVACSTSLVSATHFNGSMFNADDSFHNNSVGGFSRDGKLQGRRMSWAPSSLDSGIGFVGQHNSLGSVQTDSNDYLQSDFVSHRNSTGGLEELNRGLLSEFGSEFLDLGHLVNLELENKGRSEEAKLKKPVNSLKEVKSLKGEEENLGKIFQSKKAVQLKEGFEIKEQLEEKKVREELAAKKLLEEEWLKKRKERGELAAKNRREEEKLKKERGELLKKAKQLAEQKLKKERGELLKKGLVKAVKAREERLKKAKKLAEQKKRELVAKKERKEREEQVKLLKVWGIEVNGSLNQIKLGLIDVQNEEDGLKVFAEIERDFLVAERDPLAIFEDLDSTFEKEETTIKARYKSVNQSDSDLGERKDNVIEELERLSTKILAYKEAVGKLSKNVDQLSTFYSDVKKFEEECDGNGSMDDLNQSKTKILSRYGAVKVACTKLEQWKKETNDLKVSGKSIEQELKDLSTREETFFCNMIKVKIEKKKVEEVEVGKKVEKVEVENKKVEEVEVGKKMDKVEVENKKVEKQGFLLYLGVELNNFVQVWDDVRLLDEAYIVAAIFAGIYLFCLGYSKIAA